VERLGQGMPATGQLSRIERECRSGNGRAAQIERGHDLYETPECAVRALLKAQLLPHVIWEPASGRGAITRVLRQHGHVVHESDLIKYGRRARKADFLREKRMPDPRIGAIVTNPPYSAATAFARHALTLVPMTAMLLRLAFLEGIGRSDVLDGGNLARVLVFRNRLPRMHRDGWSGSRSTSAIAFAWFIWIAGWNKPPELHRMSWERE
jgi:hypothetical protein